MAQGRAHRALRRFHSVPELFLRTKQVECNLLRMYFCKNNTTQQYSIESSGIGLLYAYISHFATEHLYDDAVRMVILSLNPRANESPSAV